MRGRGNPGRIKPLFALVAEKLPKDSLSAVARDLRHLKIIPNGVYIAHDSMGYARYVGRGNVIQRLRARFKAAERELHYFSIYIIKDTCHEREIETLLIRAGGPHLHFNTKKKRVDIEPGNIRDFEPGTKYYERQYRSGRAPSKAKIDR